MELKQLSYFVLACQHRNHAEAARRANISASALSENLNVLEEELGLELFRRGPLGHYPSESARWLYQNVEPVLQTAEAIEQLSQVIQTEETQYLQVTTPMQFMLGKLSRALSVVTQEFRASHPNVLIRSTFGKRFDYAAGHADEDDDVSHLVIDYASKPIDPENEVLLFHDEWIAITNFDRGAEQGRVLDFGTLRNLRLLLPPLHPVQTQIATNYCSAHGLPVPVTVEEDVGTFPRLSRDAQPFVLLAPRSLVAGGLDRLQLDYASLPVSLRSPVVAKDVARHPVMREFVERLAEKFTKADEPVVYAPSITLRQLRYFEVILDQLNITAAARKLHIVQPALSGQLRKLESLAGEVLFERHRSGLDPTKAARRLAPLARSAIAQCDYVLQQSAHEAAARGQRLTIGLVPLVNHAGALVEALAGALAEWYGEHPAVKLRILEAPAAILHRWVAQGQISFGIVEAHISRSSQLDLNKQDRLAVISRAGQDLLPAGDMPFAAIEKLPLVLPSDVFGLRTLLERAAQIAGLMIRPRMEVNSLAMALALVKKMPVATILPEAAIQTLAGVENFQINPIVDPIVYRRLSVIFSTDRSLTEIERSLVSTLRRHLVPVDFSGAGLADNPPDIAPQSQTDTR